MRKLVDQFTLEYAFPDKSSVTIGRNSGCDVVIPPVNVRSNPHFYEDVSLYAKERDINSEEVYLSVSRFHATADMKYGKTTISDGCIVDGKQRFSSFGTFVNDVPARITPQQLKNGDHIKMGKLELTYKEE